MKEVNKITDKITEIEEIVHTQAGFEAVHSLRTAIGGKQKL